MGTLTINGYAKHEYIYDSMKITVGFNAYETTTTLALEKVMNQCEEFLSVLADYGIKTEDITLGENSVEKNNYIEDEADICARRELVIYSAFDMGFINTIMSLIKDKGYSAKVDFDYTITNIDTIHEALLKEALADSKRKAMIIAETMGQKVVGIDDFTNRNSGAYISDWFSCEVVHKISEGDYTRSNKLKSPVTTETENIIVTWLVE